MHYEIRQMSNTRPIKDLGQHFLHDEQVVNNILNAAGDISNCHVLEIGPGTGFLSSAILKREPASLLAIEKDTRMQEPLSKLQKKHPNFQVEFQDITRTKLPQLISQPTMVIANLPYNISSKILLQLLQNRTLFSKMVLMFQKETAQRIALPKSNHKGRLSVITDLLCEHKYEFTVPPECFTPPPKVLSAVISLIPRSNPLHEIEIPHLEQITNVLFTQRRKTILNSLSRATSNAKDILDSLNIDPGKRPEELTTEEFCLIGNALYNQSVDA